MHCTYAYIDPDSTTPMEVSGKYMEISHVPLLPAEGVAPLNPVVDATFPQRPPLFLTPRALALGRPRVTAPGGTGSAPHPVWTEPGQNGWRIQHGMG